MSHMEQDNAMDDSGFDSDQKTIIRGADDEIQRRMVDEDVKNDSPTESALKSLKKSSDLKKQIEKQREATRGSRISEKQEKLPKHGILSRSRLIVPGRQEAPLTDPDLEPLVDIDSDESEDEFAVSGLSKTVQQEITQQLIKDGYNLQLDLEDEDLELIPPRPLNQRCACCGVASVCSIQ